MQTSSPSAEPSLAEKVRPAENLSFFAGALVAFLVDLEVIPLRVSASLPALIGAIPGAVTFVVELARGRRR